MARRVITYDEAFEIIENCKPKDMDLYLEAAAKENAIGIYTEMHNYINDNIVTLDYDVDLFTEAFSWDKSKGFWANIWAWILNVWGAIKQLFLSLFGKNETVSKEEAEKLKTAAQNASEKVGSADITLDGEGIKEVDDFFKFIKNIGEKLTENEKKVDDMELGKKEARSKKLEYLNELFSKVEKVMQSVIKTKTIIKNSAEAKAIKDFLDEIIKKFSTYDEVDKDEKEANHVVALTFASLCIYNNILIALGYCAKNLEKPNMTVVTSVPSSAPGGQPTPGSANTALEALKKAAALLKVDKSNTANSGNIFKVLQLASNAMMSVLEKKVSNIFGQLGLEEDKAKALAEQDKKSSDFDNYLKIDGDVSIESELDDYKEIVNAYNRVNSSTELALPKFSPAYLFQGSGDSIISADKIKDNSDLGALDNINTSKAPGNGIIKEIKDLKDAIPFLQKFSVTILSFATTRKMAGKELLNKCYAFMNLLEKATKS